MELVKDGQVVLQAGEQVYSDILTDIKNIFDKYGINKTSAVQISISKTDKKGLLITEPSPWIVSGEAM